MARSTTDDSLFREVLAQFWGDRPRATPIELGGVNLHWLVSTGAGPFVLRRYRGERSLAAIRYEHELLSFASQLGWPVAVPIPAPNGDTVVTAADQRFSLFPVLEGEPAPYESLAHKRIKGRLLARFHTDIASFPRHEQRDGFGRAWELDLFVQPAGLDSFNALLARFATEYPDLASQVRREKYRNLRELARLGYGEAPTCVVHGDFATDNLLFSEGRLSGLLDLDLARRDAPAFDVAASLLAECVAPPDHDTIDPQLARAFIEGYTERRALTLEEARLVAPLARAAILWLAMFRLLAWHETRDPRTVRSIGRSVERRLPALASRWPDLTSLTESLAT